LRKFDEYYLFKEPPIEIDRIPERSSLMGLSDSFFCCCRFAGISIPSSASRITARWHEIDCEVHEIGISSSIEMWDISSVFFGLSSLEDLRFASHGKVRMLAAFRECDSSFRVFLPSSVELISGFCRCE
jgi:hypothetical protein